MGKREQRHTPVQLTTFQLSPVRPRYEPTLVGSLFSIVFEDSSCEVISLFLFQYSFDNKTGNFDDLPARFGYRLPSDGLKVGTRCQNLSGSQGVIHHHQGEYTGKPLQIMPNPYIVSCLS